MRADGGSVPGLSPGTPILATALPKELPWIGLRPRTGGPGLARGPPGAETSISPHLEAGPEIEIPPDGRNRPLQGRNRPISGISAGWGRIRTHRDAGGWPLRRRPCRGTRPIRRERAQGPCPPARGGPGKSAKCSDRAFGNTPQAPHQERWLPVSYKFAKLSKSLHSEARAVR